MYLSTIWQICLLLDIMIPIVFFFLLMTVNGNSAVDREPSTNRYEELEDFDSIAVTRCDALCQHLTSAENEQCHGRCLFAKGSKPGSCPGSFEGLSVFAMACLQVCVHDSECPATDKCCAHSCGVTCQPAVRLDLHHELPEIPTNVSAREVWGPKDVQIQWTFPSSSPQNKGALFLIECRSHFGRFFSSESLGPWKPVFQATQNPVVIRGLIQTAHWYIFRVAAVTANGTQGFSSPSQPFFLSKLPAKPGRPKRLGVTKIREVNGTIWAELRWTAPRSEIPIKRYKVFWSRRLPGYHPKNASDSILMHQHTLPKSKLHFQLENLRKKELYYIQVQALAVFGREKLKGAKAELFFNTTIFQDQFAQGPRRSHHNQEKT